MLRQGVTAQVIQLNGAGSTAQAACSERAARERLLRPPPAAALQIQTTLRGRPGISTQILKHLPNTETNGQHSERSKLPTHAGQAGLLSNQPAYLSLISETETLGSVSSWEGNISSLSQIRKPPNKFKTTPFLSKKKNIEEFCTGRIKWAFGFSQTFPYLPQII